MECGQLNDGVTVGERIPSSEIGIIDVPDEFLIDQTLKKIKTLEVNNNNSMENVDKVYNEMKKMMNLKNKSKIINIKSVFNKMQNIFKIRKKTLLLNVEEINDIENNNYKSNKKEMFLNSLKIDPEKLQKNLNDNMKKKEIHDKEIHDKER